MLKEIRPAIVLLVALTLITGLVYPLAITGIARRDLPVPGAGQPDREGRQGRRLGADRTGVRRRQLFPWPPVGDHYARPEGCRPRPSTRPTTPPTPMGSNLGPTSKALVDASKATWRSSKKENPSAAVPVDLVTTSGSGLDPRHLAGGGTVPGAARRQGPRPAGGSVSAPWSRARSRAAPSACSASRGSMCSSSISRSTR